MIDFLKKYSLPISLKKSIKKSRVKRQSSSYASAGSILLFFTSEGNQKIALIKNFQNKLEQEGKRVECIYLLFNEEDKPDVHLDEGMHRLLPKDFSLFGEISKPQISKLLNEDFDYLIHADLNRTIYSDLIMAKSNAKCRIGNYFEGYLDQYDMMISIPEGKTLNYLLDQMYHYTKAL